MQFTQVFCEVYGLHEQFSAGIKFRCDAHSDVVNHGHLRLSAHLFLFCVFPSQNLGDTFLITAEQQ
jgi:hypothetical protein